MKRINSILAVVDRSAEAPQVVAKAVAVARRFGARLELFLCDADLAFQLAHAFDSSANERARANCLLESKRFLESLREAANAPDVSITTEADCSSPLYISIVKKVLRSSSELVIKRVACTEGEGRCIPDANDWQLMRACPAALMLTRGRPWRVPPRLGAAVDISDHTPGDFPLDVVQAAYYLSWACQGSLDVFSAVSAASPDNHDRLEKLCTTTGIGRVSSELVLGAPEKVLPSFVSRHDYDVVVLGALTQRPERQGLVGTLTSALLETLKCDFVLVKPPTYRSPIKLAVPARASLARDGHETSSGR